ncbi:MAG: hypothetical protein SGI72_00215 [Planctomycetota bacterium]|nr:hypothetical protein [Planctomycetota bacterium]
MKLPAVLAVIGTLGLGATLLLAQTRTDARDTAAQETYFASGQLESRVEYAEGRRDGAAQRYFANGTKEAEGRYDDGRMEGEWKFWNADGSVDAERTGSYLGGDRIADGSLGAGS